ncbi:MAG: hypothetical protein Fur0010_09430 [Bdellovibrio sp.]
MSRKVLIVDDSEEFLFLIGSLLKFHNFEVENETDVNRAYEKVSAHTYSIIITDYLMEPLDGLSFAEKVRKESKNSTTPIILLTAKKLDEDEILMCSNLKLIYVTKPVMPNDLYRKVMDCLEK